MGRNSNERQRQSRVVPHRVGDSVCHVNVWVRRSHDLFRLRVSRKALTKFGASALTGYQRTDETSHKRGNPNEAFENEVCGCFGRVAGGRVCRTTIH